MCTISWKWQKACLLHPERKECWPIPEVTPLPLREWATGTPATPVTGENIQGGERSGKWWNWEGRGESEHNPIPVLHRHYALAPVLHYRRHAIKCICAGKLGVGPVQAAESAHWCHHRLMPVEHWWLSVGAGPCQGRSRGMPGLNEVVQWAEMRPWHSMAIMPNPKLCPWPWWHQFGPLLWMFTCACKTVSADASSPLGLGGVNLGEEENLRLLCDELLLPPHPLRIQPCYDDLT